MRRGTAVKVGKRESESRRLLDEICRVRGRLRKGQRLRLRKGGKRKGLGVWVAGGRKSELGWGWGWGIIFYRDCIVNVLDLGDGIGGTA